MSQTHLKFKPLCEKTLVAAGTYWEVTKVDLMKLSLWNFGYIMVSSFFFGKFVLSCLSCFVELVREVDQKKRGGRLLKSKITSNMRPHAISPFKIRYPYYRGTIVR